MLLLISNKTEFLTSIGDLHSSMTGWVCRAYHTSSRLLCYRVGVLQLQLGVNMRPLDRYFMLSLTHHDIIRNVATGPFRVIVRNGATRIPRSEVVLQAFAAGKGLVPAYFRGNC